MNQTYTKQLVLYSLANIPMNHIKVPIEPIEKKKENKKQSEK